MNTKQINLTQDELNIVSAALLELRLHQETGMQAYDLAPELITALSEKILGRTI